MHYVIALLYGFMLWLGAVLFCLILTPDLAHIAILACPLIVSGAMVVILAPDWAPNEKTPAEAGEKTTPHAWPETSLLRPGCYGFPVPCRAVAILADEIKRPL